MNQSLSFKIGAQTDAFQSAMNGCLKKLGAMAIGFAGVIKAAEAFGKALDMGGKLSDLNQQTGIAPGKLAIFQRALKNSGGEAESLGKTVNIMQKNLADAAGGGKETGAAISALGLDIEDLITLSPEKQFEEIAKKISEISDPAARAAVAMKVFGKSGAEILPLLRNFGSEMDNAKSELGSLPGIMDKSAILFDDLGDGFSALGEKSKEFAVGVLSELAPYLEKLVTSMKSVDAASFGVKLAEGFKEAVSVLLSTFRDPRELLRAFDASLTASVLEFGNGIINALATGVEVLKTFFLTLGKDTIPAIGTILSTSLSVAANAFNTLFYSGITEVLELLSKVPFIGDKLAGSVEWARQQSELFADQYERAARASNEAGDTLVSSLHEAMSTSKTINKDWLGSADAAQKAADAMEQAKKAGASLLEDWTGVAEVAGNISPNNATKPQASEDFDFSSLKAPSGGGSEGKDKFLKELAELASGQFSGSGAQARRALAMRERAKRERARGRSRRAQDLESKAIMAEDRIIGESAKRDVSEDWVENYAKKNRVTREEARRTLEGTMSDKAVEERRRERDEKESKSKTGKSSGGQSSANTLDSMVQKCRDYLKDISEKLPQHALT